MGREVSHPELGRRILDDIAERVEEYAKVEVYPRLDGRNMTMVLGPDAKKGKAKKRQEPRSSRSAGPGPAAAHGQPSPGPPSRPSALADEATRNRRPSRS